MAEKLKLLYPLNDGGNHVESLTMRRPKVRDMVASGSAEGSDEEREVRLFASLCDVPPALLEEMDIVDYKELQKIYTGFLD